MFILALVWNGACEIFSTQLNKMWLTHWCGQEVWTQRLLWGRLQKRGRAYMYPWFTDNELTPLLEINFPTFLCHTTTIKPATVFLTHILGSQTHTVHCCTHSNGRFTCRSAHSSKGSWLVHLLSSTSEMLLCCSKCAKCAQLGWMTLLKPVRIW